MSGNQVTILTSDVFSARSLIHLQEVSLAECGITKLHRHALRNLTNLVKLNRQTEKQTKSQTDKQSNRRTE